MIIDRFEGDFAVIEISENEFIKILRKELPEGVSTGDFIYLKNNTYIIDSEKTKARRKLINSLQNDLWE